ncbi:SpaH/EbpB family LPXTG-anchored major pilin [Zafaria sp. Z1313]|uniref:SpaH/EbpB family LPXTG-anchored major pilin n=1 Tax=Zafaria sp. Z1313 TaxID=3423202 RepID=UPI003D3019AB
MAAVAGDVDDDGRAGIARVGGVHDRQPLVDDSPDPAAWQGLGQLTPDQAAKQLDAGFDTVSLVTNDSGTAAFARLPIGLYLVTETDTGANNIAFHGEPFLVTIPMADANAWNYDVHVYPKNTATGLTKAVDDSGAHVIGDTVTFTLTAQVPSLPAAQTLTDFGITDALDKRLRYASATVAVEGLTLADGDYTAGADGQEFSVVFSDSGRAKLRTVQGNAITVTLQTTVASLGDGKITNQAAIYVNDPKKSFGSNTVTTSWGALTVLKHAKDEPSKTLAGAEFELYALDAQGDKIIAGPLKDVSDNDTIFTTGADGTFTVNGLKAGLFVGAGVALIVGGIALSAARRNRARTA